ncbi:MAG: HAMP domain-containing histidine kinase [Notoacmeibacter sp.]|nr:HAMP domain-containing histidine kinase [Notoacmeibacter sp.]
MEREHGALAEQHGAPADTAARVPLGRGLSVKLLVLTAIFVLLAEMIIFPPSAANFRMRWMQDKLNTATVAGLLIMKSGSDEISREVQNTLLMATGARAIAAREDGMSRLLASTDMPPAVDEQIDLAMAGSPLTSIRDAMSTMLWGGERMLRIHGKVGGNAEEVEIVIPDKELRQELLVYSRNIFLLSLLISFITAVLVFAVINRVMIRPVRTMTRSMLAFAAEPDNPSRIIVPERRNDELGIAERELSAMQTRLHRTLGEQKHLADLGLAVSKINHDLRNILSAAQLMSDRLGTIKDPAVQAFAPRLMRTLDRAVTYTQSVLSYGRAQEAPPQRRRVRLRQLVDDVGGILGVDTAAGLEFVNAVDENHEADCDAEHMFRILTNLGRNAIQSMAGDSETGVVRRLTIAATREGAVCRITVTDTGPGLPAKARDNLFAAFKGSARAGGTGLGLAIALELARAHGGSLELVESRGGHTEFAVVIPDQPVSLEAARDQIRHRA